MVEVIEPEEEEEPIPAVTDRDAGTQTSPMSLSRSSSFLWVSDCNCSGSLDGSALLLPAGTGGALSASPGDNPASSGVSRIVHMDTSATSSLVSLDSNSGGNRRRYKRMCTPDSAADAEDDEGNNPLASCIM